MPLRILFVYICFQMMQVVLCAYTLTSTHSSLQLKQGLPLFNQLVSWLTLGLPSPFPWCYATKIDGIKGIVNVTSLIVYSPSCHPKSVWFFSALRYLEECVFSIQWKSKDSSVVLEVGTPNYFLLCRKRKSKIWNDMRVTKVLGVTRH